MLIIFHITIHHRQHGDPNFYSSAIIKKKLYLQLNMQVYAIYFLWIYTILLNRALTIAIYLKTYIITKLLVGRTSDLRSEGCIFDP